MSKEQHYPVHRVLVRRCTGGDELAATDKR
jgi:hypothetical protein